MKILIVDDDEIAHILIKNYLDGNFFEFYDAYNGSEAVDMAFKNKYDLILMDQRMPTMDGLTAAKSIKSMSPDIPVISISAFDEDFDKDKLFDFFIRKPYSKELLRTVILKKLNK